MTTSTLLSGKAGAAKKVELLKTAKRLYSSAPATAPNHGSHQPPRPADPAVQRELFMDVLSANATKRDAKQYLARFKGPKQGQAQKLSPLQEQRNARHRTDQDRLDRIGVNLGGLYVPARAIAQTPQFTRDAVDEKATTTAQRKIHVALVCLRNPQKLDDATLDGVALTLSQLVKLDMHLALVLDCGSHGDKCEATGRNAMMAQQAERVDRTLLRHSRAGARLVNGALEVSDSGEASLALPKLLLEPLQRGLVPIIPRFAHTPFGQLTSVSCPSVMSALTMFFSGLPGSTNSASNTKSPVETSLDRVIILDGAGGIPSKSRGDGAHVFVNLEQEVRDIDTELAQRALEAAKTGGEFSSYQQHQENLRISQECLRLLPSASSALIITPQEAANSSQAFSRQESNIGTGTRRQKNTLIHNLLTNKPLVSSSLPTARIPSANNSSDSTELAMPAATLLKRGMPLTIIPSIAPENASVGWQAPATGTTTLDLETDPRVDLPRLVHLIEDSFRRKLDVKHYLDRIRHRTAGLIIAGEYEGGAILTWELPPPTTSNPNPTNLVPYLDKFAVLSSSQGSSGVADIVFQAMVRTCFPQGVCWRSRADNPVNKWYFERSAGTWRIPASNWTMFWTGEGVVEDEARWRDYVGVCEGVKPSWADTGKKPD